MRSLRGKWAIRSRSSRGRSKFHDFLYKVDPKSPCRTIKAQPGKFTGPFHWKNRHFTTAELKRLQSFPDDYEIVGTFGRVIEQIGNSVPPELARVIATAVREQLVHRVGKMTFPSRPQKFTATFRQRQRERTKHFRKVATAAIRERFGAYGEAAAPLRKSRTEYVRYTSLFKSTVLPSKPRSFPEGTVTFRASWQRKGRAITLDLSRVEPRRKEIGAVVRVSGLEDGLTTISGLEATCKLGSFRDLFFVWTAIEKVLVEHSRFLTLIDIYGHYANRGDTVKVTTEVAEGDAELRAAVTYFGASKHCGIDISQESVCRELGLDDDGLDELVTKMRELRYDVRTFDTHRTMDILALLCTYPFPVLSPRAHFERPMKQPSRLRGVATSEPLLF